MKDLLNTRNALTSAALSAVLAATLYSAGVNAEANDTYKTIHNGWLAEYELQPGEVVTAGSGPFRAISAENDTYASVHEGWLSEYRIQPGDLDHVQKGPFRAISAENETFATIHNGWLSEYEAGGRGTAFAKR
ncbi:MAG: hypothetical protein Kow006_05240 [Gammaproteobacteria bacterium]